MSQKSFNLKNSHPLKGGVSEGRGGSKISNLKKLIDYEQKQPPIPPSEGGEFKVEKPNAFNQKERVNNLPHLKSRRKKLRNNLTPAEARFWKAVQNKNLDGRKFRRQHSVGNYILDFYCPSEKLAVELDGEVHFSDAARDYDRERRFYLENYGIRILRFENKLVFDDLEWLLGVIKNNFGWAK